MSARRTGRFWLITVAAVVGIAVTGSLGAWQLSRAHQKIALQDEIEARGKQPPLEAPAVLGPDAKGLVHRAVVVRGRWDAARTVYLDNRQMKGKPGFYVVTPLLIDGTDRAVLVERGWAQRNFLEREKLPPVQTPGGTVEVRGRIAPPPSRLYEFDGAASGPIRQNLDIPAFRLESGLRLVDVAVVQDGPPSEGLLREWPQPATGVEKHYGYAFQWWALSTVIAILYAWFQWVAPRRRSAHAR